MSVKVTEKHVSQILSQDREGEEPAWTKYISYTVK